MKVREHDIDLYIYIYIYIYIYKYWRASTSRAHHQVLGETEAS